MDTEYPGMWHESDFTGGETDCNITRHKTNLKEGDLMAIAEECGAARIAENVAQVTREDIQRIINFVVDKVSQSQ